MTKERAFWLLIDLNTRVPLPVSQQPKSAAIKEVTAFKRNLSKTLHIASGIVLVFPGSYWEELVPVGGFPNWYRTGSEVDPDTYSGGR